MRPTVPVPAAGELQPPAFQFTDEDGLGGWEAPEIEYALALGVVRWELQDDACPVALFNFVLNCSSFDFLNSKFDHSFYSKIYTKYYFFCCGMFY